MPLQDLTPQLRTRLSRVERAVGVFVVFAALLMLSGFVYYVYHTAQRKGWFLTKARYFTFVQNASGLKVGEKVKLMGFDVGEITRITSMPATDPYFNVYVEFVVNEPYFGYLWGDDPWSNEEQGSRARVTAADFLGKRFIEVTKGTNGFPTYLTEDLKAVPIQEARSLTGQPDLVLNELIYDPDKTEPTVRPMQPLTAEVLDLLARRGSNRVHLIDRANKKKGLTAIWSVEQGVYVPHARTSKPYWLYADESAALTERLEQLVNQVQQALPGILELTNKLTTVLSNSASLTAHADLLVLDLQPAVTNLATITAQLRAPEGSLGEWLLPTNLNARLDQTLASAHLTLDSAHTTLTNTDANLTVLVSNLNQTLVHLAGITGNLRTQVETNSEILSEISRAIVHADEFVQGLKKHWLLRSAFKEEKKSEPKPRSRPILRRRGKSE